jgi:hypothetical protein
VVVGSSETSLLFLIILILDSDLKSKLGVTLDLCGFVCSNDIPGSCYFPSGVVSFFWKDSLSSLPAVCWRRDEGL